jgi:hypothetical protein
MGEGEPEIKPLHDFTQYASPVDLRQRLDRRAGGFRGEIREFPEQDQHRLWSIDTVKRSKQLIDDLPCRRRTKGG